MAIDETILNAKTMVIKDMLQIVRVSGIIKIMQNNSMIDNVVIEEAIIDVNPWQLIKPNPNNPKYPAEGTITK